MQVETRALAKKLGVPILYMMCGELINGRALFSAAMTLPLGNASVAVKDLATSLEKAALELRRQADTTKWDGIPRVIVETPLDLDGEGPKQ